MTVTSINPHRPSDVVHRFEAADPTAVSAAVDRASRAYEDWRGQPASVRGQSLARIADEMERRASELAGLVVREVGKPIREASAEVTRAVAIFRYYAQMVLAPDGDTYPAADPRAWLVARRYPIGVCALITPWNFPVAIPCWKIAPALGYGNAVLLKPASAATAIAEMLQDIARENLPEDALQVLAGDAGTGRALVD
ncbi:MAG: aldehyde dehydrogenase family protein, partial [Actinomycetota bacterium]